ALLHEPDQRQAAIAVQADVADDADCRRMVAAALAEFERLDVLVNNAATTAFIPLDDFEAVELEDWNRIFNTNVLGVFQCIRAARPALEASGNGEIVNVSSIAGLLAIGSSIPYCASKAALNNLTVALARVLAPKVRVNAVAPGLITSRWLKDGLGEAAYETYLEKTLERAPLHRVCTPEDVADLIVNLITGPDLITGQILPIEGGVMMAR
ncbi:MAG: SDR family NAD(P)-dependent oxidoreductase, partial [Blastocatellia bacterium]